MNRSQTWSRTVSPGEIIYYEGIPDERVTYVIADGKVETSTRCEEKKEKSSSRIKPARTVLVGSNFVTNE